MTDNWAPSKRTKFQRRKKPKMSTKYFDIAFTQEPDGSMLLHRADCKIARQQAAEGRPVATLYGCEILPTGTKRCACMEDK
jgi:hypothetical protein